MFSVTVTPDSARGTKLSLRKFYTHIHTHTEEPVFLPWKSANKASL